MQVSTGFSFGIPIAQPIGNIFGVPQTNMADKGMFGASASGINSYNYIVLKVIQVCLGCYQNFKLNYFQIYFLFLI